MEQDVTSEINQEHNRHSLRQEKRAAAVEMLNELNALNQGIINVYEMAVSRLTVDANICLLQSCADQHHRFVKELSNLVVQMSAQPSSSGTGSSLAKQAWVTVKAIVTEGDGPILAEVAQEAEKILIAYGEAMVKSLPEAGRQLIRTHLSDVRLSYKKLSVTSVAYER